MDIEKEREREQRDDVIDLMSTEQGRRFVWRLLSYTGIYRAHEGDSESILKQEGRRQVGLYLLGIVSDVAEDRVFDMMREAKNQSIQEKLQHEQSNNTNRSSVLDSYIGDDTDSGGYFASYSSGADGNL
jgi:hypothetical protein